MDQTPPLKVIAYIDGFNLYYGMRESNFREYYWLDVPQLARNLLKPHQLLVYTRYFTARVAGPTSADAGPRAVRLEAKRTRQATFLDAVATLPDCEIIEGQYFPKTKRCFACRSTWTQHEEKMTDVNIATRLLCDAFSDAFDMALIISGDSDLVPPVLAIREFFPEKRVVVAFPPKRHSDVLKRVAHAGFIIGRARLRDSQLPDVVTSLSGFELKRPDRWR